MASICSDYELYAGTMGWKFVRLDGKRPLHRGWTNGEDLDDVLAHKGNIGLVTGMASGVAVVDVDEGADIDGLDLPDTVMARTGTGYHYYYRIDRPIGNSASKIAPHVDLRGDGGQVVFPGSVHPETGIVYEWVAGCAPDDIEMEPMPGWIYPKPQPAQAPAADGVRTPYAQSALDREAAAVRDAPEGERNAQLNKSAFNLGQLVSGGALLSTDVQTLLTDAALSAGLEQAEVDATLGSGLKSGMKEPRTVPASTVSALPAAPGPRQDGVLTPGMHRDTEDTYYEQTTATFAEQVLEEIPDDELYRRSTMVGEIIGEPGTRKWLGISIDRVRTQIDRHTRLCSWVTRKEDDQQVLVYKPPTKDLAGLVIAEAERTEDVRSLDRLVNYPVFLPNWQLAAPGWREGLYFDEPPVLTGLEPVRDLEAIRDGLEGLVIDFPFADEASRQNFFALMLTPLIAPAVPHSNRPLFLVHSPMERTGKSKLAEEVLGGVILGKKTPALQLTGTDDEREKRITGLLIQGGTIAHLDNLPAKLDSPSLASLVTAQTYQSRLLGQNKILELPNHLTLVASGNNVECSSEIAKRTVPIMLQPRTAHPERRTNFAHPDLTGHVAENRKLLLECLLGMVLNWVDAGHPGWRGAFGGFEGWVRTVGGILRTSAFNQFMKNQDLWLDKSDLDGAELSALVREWHHRYKDQQVSPADLLPICVELGILGFATSKPTERGQATALGGYLRKRVDRVVESWTIRRSRSRNGNSYVLH